MHENTGHRSGDQEGDQAKPQKILRQDEGDISERGAQHFADTDLFGLLLDDEGQQADEPQYIDDNGDGREDVE
jgi:hypothetical protein